MLVSELFDIYQGNGFELINMEIDKGSDINFVARTGENNGVVAKVAKIDKEPFQAGLITVAVGGSVLSSFVQNKPFYTGFHVLVLKPKKEMSLEEKLFYCHVIKMNAYRYSYGRQANRTLKNINLPPLPDWLKKYKIDYSPINTQIKHKELPFNTTKWKSFSIADYFEIRAGKYHYPVEYQKGKTPYISATAENNGVGEYIDLNPEFSGNVITTEKVKCSAFYQHDDFCATSDVNILTPKGFKLNKYIGMFLSTVINFNEKFRWNYGKQCRIQNMKKMFVKLPVDKNGNPDWDYMENYIKSLPYSDLI